MERSRNRTLEGIPMNNWFTVDKEGLKALQAGKPKTFIINELTQNAWDENITKCGVFIQYDNSKKEISVEVRDNNPEGFKDITHAYTLFADTYKRKDPSKRGRFNLGEKQVLSISNYAKVTTTKGTILFDSQGRHELPEKTNQGSRIEVIFDGTEEEMNELISHAKTLLVPEHIEYVVNGNRIPSKPVFKTVEASLDTEVLRDGVMVSTSRKTKINLVASNGQSYIYEMGIPVMETDCYWNIDVLQKIPLAVDRETIRPYYLQDLYAVILNETYQHVPEDDASALWIRTGMKDDRIKKEAVQGILEKRFGGKVLSRNPFDPHANEEAISNGYNLITGNQMSKEEWQKVRELGLIKSTTEEFGSDAFATAKAVTPTPNQRRFALLSKKVAKEFLGINLDVVFIRCDRTNVRADYGNHRLRFNLSLLGNGFFDTVDWQNLRLLIHELAHEHGGHLEHEYHYAMTKLGAQLTLKALEEPSWFEVN